MGWTEKRLLGYHETFNTGNIYSLHYIVLIGISAAKILVENQDMSYEYHSGVKGDIDVMRSRIETYIHSSLRSAFAQVSSKQDDCFCSVVSLFKYGYFEVQPSFLFFFFLTTFCHISQSVA